MNGTVGCLLAWSKRSHCQFLGSGFDECWQSSQLNVRVFPSQGLEEFNRLADIHCCS